jgi:hypothetical protein
MNIAAQPTCSPLPPNTTCYWNSYITVSPDGNTVFIAGDSNFVVVPVANANLLPVASTPPPGVHKLSRGGFVPWRLTLQ